MEKIKRVVAYTLVFVLVFGLFAGLGLYGGSQSNESLVNAKTSSGNDLVWEIVPNTSVASASGMLTGATVEVYTPKTLREKLAAEPASIASVDMFIIHQGSTSGANSFFASSTTADNWLGWAEAYAIFKKIAGANGAPAKYVIDASIYTNTPAQSSSPSQGFALASTPYTGNMEVLPVSVSGTAFKNNATKLFVMLQIMDPGTFYGLYFASRAENYGINENNGAIIGYGYNANNDPTVRESGSEEVSWSIARLKPYFMMTASNQSLSSIGWDESRLAATAYTAGKRGFAYSGSLSSKSSDISSLLSSTLTFSLDTKQYRFLVVEPNEKGSVDRRIAFKMATLANTANESMVGGVVVDNVSMHNLQSYTKDISDSYDCVYFGMTEETLSGQHNGYTTVLRNKQYTKLGPKYDIYFTMWGSQKWNKMFFGGDGTTYRSGLDLTYEKYYELQCFAGAGGVIVYDSNVVDTSYVDDDTYIYTLLTTYNDPENYNVFAGSMSDANISTIKALVNPKLSVVIIDKPVEYYSKTDFNYIEHSPSDGIDYVTKERNPGVQYINGEESNKNNRTLNFKFRVSGATSYKYNFYIDVNNDGRYFENEKKVDGEALSVTADGVGSFSYSVGESFSGAIGWKVEVYDSSDENDIFSETGCCAVKNWGSAKTINVLQIIPVDDGSYTNMNHPVYDASSDVYNNPTLLLPMKKEIRDADNAHTAATRMSALDGISKSNIETILNYFSGHIKIQTHSDRVDPTRADYTEINRNSYEEYGGNLLIQNAGLFYYFLLKGNIGDLNVLRISIDELADRVTRADTDQYKIKFDGNKITYLNPDTNSGTVTCDLLVIGFCDYLVEQSNHLTGTLLANTRTAIDKIANYIEADGPTFMGGGVLQVNSSDYATVKLMDACGLDRTGVTTGASTNPALTTWGWNILDGEGASGEAMKTNDGTLVRYPYSIPDYILGGNVRPNPFQTNVDTINGEIKNDISVFFAMTNIMNSPNNYHGYNSRGDVVNFYYLFKKGNLTYSAVSMTEVDKAFGQKSSYLRLPEAALLVNAIVATTNGDPGHTEETKKAPYTVPKDNPGSNELPVKKDVPYMPTLPSGGTDSTGMKYDQHSIYVYPEYDGTKQNVSDLISDNPSITSDNKFIFNFQVVIPDGCDTVKIDIFAGGKNISLPVKTSSGSTVTNNTISKSDTGKMFYVEIPLDSAYYTSQGLNSGVNKFGMDLTDNFEVKVVTTPNFASPSTSSINGTITDVHVVKRGVFRIN